MHYLSAIWAAKPASHYQKIEDIYAIKDSKKYSLYIWRENFSLIGRVQYVFWKIFSSVGSRLGSWKTLRNACQEAGQVAYDGFYLKKGLLDDSWQELRNFSKASCVFASNNSNIYRTVRAELEALGPVQQGSLSKRAAKTCETVLAFLTQLGISTIAQEDGTCILSDLDLEAIEDNKSYNLENYKLMGKAIKELICATEVTYVKSGSIEAGNLRKDVGQSASQDFSDSQFVMVSGPVHLPFTSDLQSTLQQEPVQAYSIPGINYAYSQIDINTFSSKGSVNQAGEQRMRQIMGHVFEKMKQDQVKEPILSAIGCGAFAGNVQLVPEKWAEAIYDLLAKNDYQFSKVWIALPKIGTSKNFHAFKASLEKCLMEKAPLKCPIVIADASMMAIAKQLSDSTKVGILNPSDAQAIREGKIGMYWNGGHIALEEFLACSSTILLQQIALRYKDAYQKAKEISLT